MNKSKYNYIIVLTKPGFTKKPISLLSDKRLDYAAVVEFLHARNPYVEVNDFILTELEDVESFVYEDALTKMKRERDEARILYCEEAACLNSKYYSFSVSPKGIASNRMWDCYDNIKV